jgi:hypothetical protein
VGPVPSQVCLLRNLPVESVGPGVTLHVSGFVYFSPQALRGTASVLADSCENAWGGCSAGQ